MLALTLFRQMGRRFGNLFPVFYFHWLIYRVFYVPLQMMDGSGFLPDDGG